MNNLSNEQLIQSYRDTGNEDYITELYNINVKFIYHCAHKYDHNIPFDDLTSLGNIAFTKAYQNFDVTKGYKFVTYLGTLLMNEFNMEFRRYKRNIGHQSFIRLDAEMNLSDDSSTTVLDTIPDPTDSYEELLSNASVKSICKYAKSILSPTQYKLFVGKYVNNKTHVELAKLTGYSQPHISRKLKLVRSRLNPERVRRYAHES